jgi:signal peptidase II
MKRSGTFFLIALVIIIIDQASKLLVHEYMTYGPAGEIQILGDLFKLHYTLNPGMAFGMEFGSDYGKLGLTFFRLIAAAGISWFIYSAAKKPEEYNKYFVLCMSFILAGAVGNLIDSIFYGVFIDFNAIPYSGKTPPFYPWFHGQVIDMLYFDIWEGPVPEFIPFIGGNYYSMWPIFNIADASIFLGVTAIFIFQKKFFPKEFADTSKEEETNKAVTTDAEAERDGQ